VGRRKKPPGKPPKKPKAPAGSDGHGHELRLRQLQAKVDRGLEAADLTDAQREEYRQAERGTRKQNRRISNKECRITKGIHFSGWALGIRRLDILYSVLPLGVGQWLAATSSTPTS
jgi:hypothetical protein